jgi:TolB-like protein
MVKIIILIDLEIYRVYTQRINTSINCMVQNNHTKSISKSSTEDLTLNMPEKRKLEVFGRKTYRNA